MTSDVDEGDRERRHRVGTYSCETTCQEPLCWLRGTVVHVERWSLTGELSLSCARPAADG